MVFTSYKVNNAASTLQHDFIFKFVLDKLNLLIQTLFKLFHEFQAIQEIVLNLDSTHSDR